LFVLDQLFGGSNDVKILRDNLKQFVRELSGPNGLGFDSVRAAFAVVDPSSSGASHTVTVYSSLSSNIDAVRLRYPSPASTVVDKFNCSIVQVISLMMNVNTPRQPGQNARSRILLGLESLLKADDLVGWVSDVMKLAVVVTDNANFVTTTTLREVRESFHNYPFCYFHGSYPLFSLPPTQTCASTAAVPIFYNPRAQSSSNVFTSLAASLPLASQISGYRSDQNNRLQGWAALLPPVIESLSEQFRFALVKDDAFSAAFVQLPASFSSGGPYSPHPFHPVI
jgi:hypothetical protein